jgi:hypothetical protein
MKSLLFQFEDLKDNDSGCTVSEINNFVTKLQKNCIRSYLEINGNKPVTIFIRTESEIWFGISLINSSESRDRFYFIKLKEKNSVIIPSPFFLTGENAVFKNERAPWKSLEDIDVKAMSSLYERDAKRAYEISMEELKTTLKTTMPELKTALPDYYNMAETKKDIFDDNKTFRKIVELNKHYMNMYIAQMSCHRFEYL